MAISNCLNCNKPFSNSDKFCASCGQKTNAHILTVGELITNFWSSIWNIDNTIFRTFRYIWTPWLLTKFYVAGKRIPFLNPMRLFLITLLFHFAYLLSIVEIDNVLLKSINIYNDLERSKMYDKYETLKSNSDLDESSCLFASKVEKEFFSNTKATAKDTFFMESLFEISEYPITRKEAIEMPIDSIYKKYNITTYFDKLKVKQMIKLNLDRAGSIKYAVGNAAWGILILVLMIAGLMKLLYYRNKRFFVEHLVFLMNVHSLSFLVVSFLLFIETFYDTDDAADYTALSISFILPLIFFTSLKMYYRQGFFKTLLKFFLLGFSYFFLGFIFILVVGFGSLFFF